MMTTKFRRLILICAAIPASAAATFESHEAIDARIADALVGTGYNALPVDRRLKLVACPETLRVDPPTSGAVAVHCGASGWRLRVLLDGPPATVTIRPVLIRRGDPVTVKFVASGFSVTSSGIADGDARLGERVRVRVADKASPVMGEAIDVGSVRVAALN